MTLPRPVEAPDSFSGQTIAVLGMGIEGRDAARFATRDGARVITVDQHPRRAERTQDDFALLGEVDGIIASQGVPYNIPLLVEANRRGLPVYGPLQIFLERCPAPVIGITGSAGKTTTTTLVYEMLSSAGVPCIVGGNIGQGLLGQLPVIGLETTVVAEISHTQLLRTTRSPRLAAITNITPNHLDQFSWADYQALKLRIVRYQSSLDTVVLPFEDELAHSAANLTEASQCWFGLRRPSLPWYCAVWSDGRDILQNEHRVMAVDELLIPGEHNLLNALAALAIVADRVPRDVAAQVLRSFKGVPHRLELVAEVEGVRFINDSIATTPERTLAGLRATTGEIVLMLGGRDKNLPLDPLRAELERHVSQVVLFGDAASKWTAWLSRRGINAVDAGTFESAFACAARTARSGQAVLMSPAGTSFDGYPNFEARGQHFRDLVAQWAQDRSAFDGR